MTAAERQARRRKRAGKSINRRRRTLYKIANENETRKEKRARREEILAEIAERTKAATAALDEPDDAAVQPESISTRPGRTTTIPPRPDRIARPTITMRR